MLGLLTFAFWMVKSLPASSLETKFNPLVVTRTPTPCGTIGTAARAVTGVSAIPNTSDISLFCMGSPEESGGNPSRKRANELPLNSASDQGNRALRTRRSNYFLDGMGDGCPSLPQLVGPQKHRGPRLSRGRGPRRPWSLS